MQRSLKMMMRLDQSRGLNAWREFREQLVSRQAAARRCVLQMMQGDLCRGWASWADAVAQRREEAAALRQSVVFMLNSALVSALARWRTNGAAEQAMRRGLAHMVNH